MNIISSGTYEEKKGYISFELSKEMRNFFFNLKKNFTQFQLETALSLRSKFSKRLYEMLSQYRDTGIFHTAIRELKLRLGLIDENKGIEKFKNFNMFRKKVLEVAKKEFEEKADITFTYKAEKTKNKYTHLIFSIVSKKSQLASSQQEDIEKTLHKLITEFKLSQWQAKRIVERVTHEEIGKTLFAVRLEKINGRIKNIGACTAKVFDNKYQLNFIRQSP